MDASDDDESTTKRGRDDEPAAEAQDGKRVRKELLDDMWDEDPGSHEDVQSKHHETGDDEFTDDEFMDDEFVEEFKNKVYEILKLGENLTPQNAVDVLNMHGHPDKQLNFESFSAQEVSDAKIELLVDLDVDPPDNFGNLKADAMDVVKRAASVLGAPLDAQGDDHQAGGEVPVANEQGEYGHEKAPPTDELSDDETSTMEQGKAGIEHSSTFRPVHGRNRQSAHRRPARSGKDESIKYEPAISGALRRMPVVFSDMFGVANNVHSRVLSFDTIMGSRVIEGERYKVRCEAFNKGGGTKGAQDALEESQKDNKKTADSYEDGLCAFLCASVGRLLLDAPNVSIVSNTVRALGGALLRQAGEPISIATNTSSDEDGDGDEEVDVQSKSWLGDADEDVKSDAGDDEPNEGANAAEAEVQQGSSVNVDAIVVRMGLLGPVNLTRPNQITSAPAYDQHAYISNDLLRIPGREHVAYGLNSSERAFKTSSVVLKCTLEGHAKSRIAFSHQGMEVQMGRPNKDAMPRVARDFIGPRLDIDKQWPTEGLIIDISHEALVTLLSPGEWSMRTVERLRKCHSHPKINNDAFIDPIRTMVLLAALGKASKIIESRWIDALLGLNDGMAAVKVHRTSQKSELTDLYFCSEQTCLWRHDISNKAFHGLMHMLLETMVGFLADTNRVVRHLRVAIHQNLLRTEEAKSIVDMLKKDFKDDFKEGIPEDVVKTNDYMAIARHLNRERCTKVLVSMLKGRDPSLMRNFVFDNLRRPFAAAVGRAQTTDATDFDMAPVVAFQDGYLFCVKSMAIRKIAPRDRCSVSVPYDAPRKKNTKRRAALLRFLKEIYPDPGVRWYVVGLYARALRGDQSSPRLIVHYGEGGAGKSLMFQFMAEVWGDEMSLACKEAFLNKSPNENAESASPTDAMLKNRRFVCVDEVNKIHQTRCKYLLNGMSKLARKLHEDLCKVLPRFPTMNVSTNTIIQMGNTDGGMQRRVRVILYEKAYTEVESMVELDRRAQKDLRSKVKRQEEEAKNASKRRKAAVEKAAAEKAAAEKAAAEKDADEGEGEQPAKGDATYASNDEEDDDDDAIGAAQNATDAQDTRDPIYMCSDRFEQIMALAPEMMSLMIEVFQEAHQPGGSFPEEPPAVDLWTSEYLGKANKPLDGPMEKWCFRCPCTIKKGVDQGTSNDLVDDNGKQCRHVMLYASIEQRAKKEPATEMTRKRLFTEVVNTSSNYGKADDRPESEDEFEGEDTFDDVAHPEACFPETPPNFNMCYKCGEQGHEGHVCPKPKDRWCQFETLKLVIRDRWVLGSVPIPGQKIPKKYSKRSVIHGLIPRKPNDIDIAMDEYIKEYDDAKNPTNGAAGAPVAAVVGANGNA